MTGIRIYLRNLWLAVRGRNPYLVELDGVKEDLAKAREELEKAVGNARLLGELYERTEVLMKEDDKTINGYKTLVENLRERIREKDDLIARMQGDYRKSEQAYKDRIAGYSAQIAALQESRKNPSDRRRGTKKPANKKPKTINK